MESIQRISCIPIVESGLKTAESVYFRLKKSNALFNWSLGLCESTLLSTFDSLRPGFKIFEGTISRFDALACQSLDAMEQRLPATYLPPQVIYWNTREYMADLVVRPVLKRANSFKELGHVVLDSKVSHFAAGRLDDAIDAADKYVERYLPIRDDNEDESRDEVDVDENKNSQNGATEIIHAFHRGQRLSKKLKRRLTHRTIAEFADLKKQSKEAIHILFYAAELIVTDPKQAYQKAQELWSYLSENEPENQARPVTMEQLVVLLTRETARRMVHFINYTRFTMTTIPDRMKQTQTELMHQFLSITNSLLEMARLKTGPVYQEVAQLRERIAGLYEEVQDHATNGLERLAVFVSGRVDEEKGVRDQGSNNNQNHIANGY